MKHRFFPFVRGGPGIKVGIARPEHLLKGTHVFITHQLQQDPLIIQTLEFQIPDLVLSEILFQVFHRPFQITFYGLGHLHFQVQVYSALEIKTKVYLICGQNVRPPRGKFFCQRRYQIHQRNNDH